MENLDTSVLRNSETETLGHWDTWTLGHWDTETLGLEKEITYVLKIIYYSANIFLQLPL